MVCSRLHAIHSQADSCVARSSKTLRLPGSHGHVFPWDPPSFGVPDAILVKLAQKLREDILRLATANARMIIDRSEESSRECLEAPDLTDPNWRLRVLAAFEKSTSRPRESSLYTAYILVILYCLVYVDKISQN